MKGPQPITGSWVVLGIVIALLTVGFIRLGFWQLDRLGTVQERNEVLDIRLAGGPVPLDALVIPGVEQDPADLFGWPVEVTGTFLPGEWVLIRGRALDGLPGMWLVAPLRLSDGSVVAVNRGWVPIELADPDDERLASPVGEVTVEGYTTAGEQPTRFGPQDPDEGRLAAMSNLDLDRLGRQVGVDFVPVVVQAAGPVGASLPTPLPAPTADDPGPHVAYAIQWFGFAAVVVVGFVALVGRQLARGPLARSGARSPTGRAGPSPG